jgi:hypothetical protein
MKTLILREILYGIWVDNKCQSYDPLQDLSHFIIRYYMYRNRTYMVYGIPIL